MYVNLTQWVRHAKRAFVFVSVLVVPSTATTAQQLLGPLLFELYKTNEATVVASSPVAAQDSFAFKFPEELLTERLAHLQKTIPLRLNKEVQGFIEIFTMRNRGYLQRALDRKSFYFPIFEETLRKNGLPEELKYLSVVESDLNPKAVSRVGAVGLWQFMPATGKGMGLRQDVYVDERMDIHKSTQAACSYLKSLYNMFSDWELAMAAYNCGPGTIHKAIRKSGNKTTFWEIYPYLPRETRSYIPIYIAVIYVMNHHQDYKFGFQNPMEYIASDTIQLSRPLDMKVLLDELNVTPEQMQVLNPHLKKGKIPAYLKNYPLRLPQDKATFFRNSREDVILAVTHKQPTLIEELEVSTLAASISSAGSSRKKITHTVRKGDGLGKIAEKYHVGVSELKKWNKLRGNTIKAGQHLAIWIQGKAKNHTVPAEPTVNAAATADVTTKDPTAKETTLVAKAEENKPAPRVMIAKPQTYEVQRGDTLWSISKNQGITVETLKKLNNLKGNTVKPGQKLIVG